MRIEIDETTRAELYQAFPPDQVLLAVHGSSVPTRPRICGELCRHFGTSACVCTKKPNFGICASFEINAISVADGHQKVEALRAKVALH